MPKQSGILDSLRGAPQWGKVGHLAPEWGTHDTSSNKTPPYTPPAYRPPRRATGR